MQILLDKALFTVVLQRVQLAGALPGPRGSDLKIKVTDIPASDREYRFEIESGKIADVIGGREDLSCTSPGLAEINLSRIGDVINLRGSVFFNSRISCSRCLEQFDFEIRTRLKLTLSKKRGNENEEDDIGVGYYSGERIDLSKYCIETVHLNLPQNLLCNENCKGLCYVCGHNLNESECGCDR